MDHKIIFVRFVFLFVLLVSNNVHSKRLLYPEQDQDQAQQHPHVQLNLPTAARVIHQVDKRFLSVAIDSFQLYRWWKRLDLRNERLRTLTKYLQPAYLRIGGTYADVLEFSSGTPSEVLETGNYENGNGVYNRGDESETNIRQSSQRQNQLLQDEPDTDEDFDNGGDRFKNPRPPKKFYGIHLLKLSEFVKETNLDLIFGLNALIRNGSHWNSSNALEMMTFMSSHGIPVAGWELGNEPNLFPRSFNITMQPKYIANDFSDLRRILQKFDLYKESLVIGPDTTNPDKPVKLADDSGSLSATKYLQQFLKYVDPKSLDRVSFHQYYFEGRTSNVADFLNTTIMDKLKYQINLGKLIVNQTTPGKSLWLGETSSAWGGGAPNISNSFAGIFMWLDKLGQSALNGIQVVVRQSLIGGWYGLINQEGNPTPNYFVSLLYKHLVGEKVISLDSSLLWSPQNKSRVSVKQNLRLYAHCAKSGLHANTPGAVALYLLNPSNDQHLIQVEGAAGVFIEEYLIQAPSQNIRSTSVNLNGRLLSIGKSSEYPALRPQIRTRSFIVPRFSAGFWVLKYANVDACKY